MSIDTTGNTNVRVMCGGTKLTHWREEENMLRCKRMEERNAGKSLQLQVGWQERFRIWCDMAKYCEKPWR